MKDALMVPNQNGIGTGIDSSRFPNGTQMAPSPFHENDPYIVCSGGCVSNEIILVISIPGHILKSQPLKHIPSWEGLVQKWISFYKLHEERVIILKSL